MTSTNKSGGMKKGLLGAGICVLAAWVSLVNAQELEGTLKKVSESGSITVGHRDGGIPFSYYDDKQQPVGYAMDLCGKLVDAVKVKLGKPDLKVEYVPVTGTTRIPLLANGTIDMECGTTTNNAERQRQVAFSTTYFVAGVRIMAKKADHITGLQDLKGKTIVTPAGTTSVRLLNEANNKDDLGMRILSAKDNAEALLTVETGRAVAYVFDDVSLAGVIASSRSPEIWEIVGDALSVEPYGIMLRRNDAQFKALADETLGALYASGEINAIYDKWFLQPIPPRGILMNLPMSEQLKKVVAAPTDSADPQVYQ
ncbi:transporter substrate-binding domain-containing protein [Pseudomonas sp. UBA6310]|nr:transporter substrate-binding domain-containing protein [Pseudomonas sp. UBA6310]